MILTVEELRKYIETDQTDEALEMRLLAIEQSIRGYTNNSFTDRHSKRLADIVGGTFTLDEAADFEPGDTVQVRGVRNNGLFTIKEATETTFKVNEKTRDEIDAYVAKVVYPYDVMMGTVSLMRWELEAREKSWIQSETISRHTVNYLNLDAWNSEMGYPKSLIGFLAPYMKARFGRGLDS